MDKLLLIANDGFVKVVIDSLGNKKDIYEIGVVDACKDNSINISDVNVVGRLDDLEKLYKNGYKMAFVAIESDERNSIYRIVKEMGFALINIKDDSAIISDSVILGQGNYIGKNVTIGCDTKIFDNCLISTASIIGYGTQIYSNTIVSMAAIVGNNVCIEECCCISPRSIIGDGVRVKANIKTKICELIE